MGYLRGFNEYLDAHYNESLFDQAVGDGNAWETHIHGHRVVEVRVLENLTYDVRVDVENSGVEILPKIHIKFLYSSEIADAVKPLIRENKAVKSLAVGPHFSPRYRNHVKNKTLYPLMEERDVLFFTLLEGEVVKGIVGGFNRYEITLHMKGALPVTILRHSIYDIRDKKGRCYLKSHQEKRQDWQKSRLYVEEKEKNAS